MDQSEAVLHNRQDQEDEKPQDVIRVDSQVKLCIHFGVCAP